MPSCCVRSLHAWLGYQLRPSPSARTRSRPGWNPAGSRWPAVEPSPRSAAFAVDPRHAWMDAERSRAWLNSTDHSPRGSGPHVVHQIGVTPPILFRPLPRRLLLCRRQRLRSGPGLGFFHGGIFGSRMAAAYRFRKFSRARLKWSAWLVLQPCGAPSGSPLRCPQWPGACAGQSLQTERWHRCHRAGSGWAL